MIRYHGAKLWVNKITDIESDALDQIADMINHSATIHAGKEDVGVAIMPDVHTGYSVPIGSVWVLKDYISPAAVGYDIGCGVFAVPLPMKVEEFADRNKLVSLDAKIRRFLPVGFNHRTERHHMDTINRLIKDNGFEDSMRILEDLQYFTKTPLRSQLGTLGGGNHFIELNTDQYGMVWVVIHSGSRKFGWDIAKHYMDLAKEQDIHNVIPALRLHNMELGFRYYVHMQSAEIFAEMNRTMMSRIIMEKIKEVFGAPFNIDDTMAFDVTHNHAVAMEQPDGSSHVIHRKGATPAHENTEVIIPGSMGTFTFIGVGKGNSLSYRSCSHGAGRRMSRKKAKKELSLSKFQEDMEGIFSASVTEKNLDECPDAYKDVAEVVKLQDDLITTRFTLKPIFNIKG